MKKLTFTLITGLSILFGCGEQHYIPPDCINLAPYKFDAQNLLTLDSLILNVDIVDDTIPQLFHIESRMDNDCNPFIMTILGTPSLHNGTGSIEFELFHQQVSSIYPYFVFDKIRHRQDTIVAMDSTRCFDSVFDIYLSFRKELEPLHRRKKVPIVSSLPIYPNHLSDISVNVKTPPNWPVIPKKVRDSTCKVTNPFSSGVLICTVKFI